MSFQEEFDSFFNDLGAVGTAGYKFFDAFKFDSDSNTISYHEDFEHEVEDETLFKMMRDFVKQEKKNIRNLKKEVNGKELQRKCLFFFMKLQENGIFSVNERKYILIYTDFCLDRIIK